jgi:cell shape-determining protein MreC
MGCFCGNRTIKSNEQLSSRVEHFRKENCLLTNQLKDLEHENNKLKDNSANLKDYMNQTIKINELERENRMLKTDVDYLKYRDAKISLSFMMYIVSLFALEFLGLFRRKRTFIRKSCSQRQNKSTGMRRELSILNWK